MYLSSFSWISNQCFFVFGIYPQALLYVVEQEENSLIGDYGCNYDMQIRKVAAWEVIYAGCKNCRGEKGGKNGELKLKKSSCE